MELLDRIRKRAHELWEREGRPEGRHEAHWQQAMQEITAADGAGPPPVLSDPDAGAALAGGAGGGRGDPDGGEPAAGKGGTGPIVAARPGEGGMAATPRGRTAAAKGEG
ncbi:MAG: hypothetical protein RIR62_1628 [Pseudomonadota bacterium]|jgi:hypothetical protein